MPPRSLYEQDGNIFVVSVAEGAKPRPIANSEALEEEPTINRTGTLVAYRKGTAHGGPDLDGRTRRSRSRAKR